MDGAGNASIPLPARARSPTTLPSQPENGASARLLESPAVKFADDAAHGQRRDVELTPSGRVKLRSSTIVQDLVRSAQSLDEEQIAEFKECFSLFDVDGSGSIDTSELKSVMTSLGQKMTDEELEQMIKNVDADGSGTVDFAEFLGMMALQMRDHDADVILERVFGRFAGVDERIRVKHLNFVFAHLCEKMSGSEIESLVKEAARGEESMSFTQFMSMFRVTPAREKPKNSADGMSTRAKAPAQPRRAACNTAAHVSSLRARLDDRRCARERTYSLSVTFAPSLRCVMNQLDEPTPLQKLRAAVCAALRRWAFTFLPFLESFAFLWRSLISRSAASRAAARTSVFSERFF